MAANVTLDQVIRSLIIETGKGSTHEYQRLLQLGTQGLKELSFDVLRQVRTIKLKIQSDGTVILPDDYVGYVKIGIHGADDRIHVLGLDSRRYLKTDSTGQDVSEDSNDYYIFRNFMFQGKEGELYGIGGGNNSNGYYREDKENGRLMFSNISVSKTIGIEYISDGVTGLSGDQIKVSPYAEEALRSYIYWKSIQRKRSIIQSEKEAARRDYYNEKRLARARMSKFTKEEALQTSRKAFKQAPKM